MPKKVRYGWKAKIYLRTAGTFGAPTWTEIDLAGDLKVSPKYKSQTIPTREGKGLELEEVTFLGLEVSGKIRDDDSVAVYTTLDDAFHARTAVDVLVLNGARDEAGSRGYRMEWKVHTWEQSQGNDEVLMKDFTLKPCIGDNVKQRAVVAVDGTIAFTELAAA